MIVDLQDDRRAAKTWLPDDDRDVTNGLVVEGWRGKPRCVLHGQMHRVDPHEHIYRCGEFRCGVGARWSAGPDTEVRTRASALPVVGREGFQGGPRRPAPGPFGDKETQR